MLSKKQKKLLWILGVVLFVVGLDYTIHVQYREFYKIGKNGEEGEMTIMHDYIIFGKYWSLLKPTKNYIKLPIKYDRSYIVFKVSKDSTITIGPSYPEIESYDLSCFREIQFVNDNAQLFYNEHINYNEIAYIGRIEDMGYAHIPAFYYNFNDTACIRQRYTQSFPFETQRIRTCWYDTIAVEMFSNWIY